VILVNHMMQIHSKKIVSAILGASMSIAAFSPILASAQVRDNVGFCAQIDTITSNIDQRMADRTAKLNTARANVKSQLSAKKTARDTKLAQSRAKWDQNRTEQYAKLESKAATDVQKQALVSFKTSVNTAISTRRAAVDSASLAYRQGLAAALNARMSAVDAAMTTFKNAEAQAVAKAKADCAAGVKSADVRTAFRASMKAAQDTFQNSRKAIDNVKPTIDALQKTRNDAVKKAISDFESAMDKARRDLKAALGR
jgi:hypothetical protein